MREGTRQHVCEIIHCGRPAPTTTICHECAGHVHDAIYDFLNVELDRLLAIAYGIEGPAERAARQSHSKQASPPDALKINAWVLHRDITVVWPELLDDLATRPDAENLYWQIIGGCERAQAMINGDPKTYAEGDVKQVNRELATPMTMPKLIDWMWDRFRLKINRQQVYNWTHRGKIKAAIITGQKYKMYRPKDVLEHV